MGKIEYTARFYDDHDDKDRQYQIISSNIKYPRYKTRARLKKNQKNSMSLLTSS